MAGSSDGTSMGLHSKKPRCIVHNCGLTELKQEPAQFKLKEPEICVLLV